jgi:5-methylcytosine-specific restriction protein A
VRREFSAKVKQAAYKRSKGLCEECAMKLQAGRFHYDHVKPDGLGGEPTLENCQVLCTPCHRTKTKEQDMPIMRRADAQKRAHLGQRGPKAKIPAPPKRTKEGKPSLPPRKLYGDE